MAKLKEIKIVLEDKEFKRKPKSKTWKEVLIDGMDLEKTLLKRCAEQLKEDD